MKLILPSEAQQIIMNFGLRDFYFNKDFKKYSVKDFGERKIMNMCRFDEEFRTALSRKDTFKKYSRTDGFNRFLESLKKSRYCFYDEDEVLDWVLTMKSF